MIRPMLLASALALAIGAPAGAAQEADINPETYDAANDPLFPMKNMEAHMGFLSHDLMEGREAGTRGFDLAANYVEAQFKLFGLTPAGDDGTYRQAVTLRNYSVDVENSAMSLTKDGETHTLDFSVDFVTGGNANATEVSADADLVFAGYGVSTDLHDDYADIDAEGKIVVVMLAPPPGVPSEIAAHLGSTATKAETARAKGAAGMIMIIPPGARFNFELLSRFATRAQTTWVSPDGVANSAYGDMAGGAISDSTAEMIFDGAEMSYAALLEAMGEDGEGIRSFDLPASAAITVVTSHEDVQSSNVVGMVEGSDPELKDEYIVLTAHLDHIGIAPRVDGGDAINNGTMDNSAGTAAMLEVARVAASNPAPGRTLVFLSVTAEEKGLLGADHWIQHPTVPKEDIVANINLDMPILLYEFTDVVAFGAEHSSMGPMTERALSQIGVTLTPDPIPEQNLFTRSDHYRFVQQGVPSVFLMTGFEGEGQEKFTGFLQSPYHQPGDDMSQDLNFKAGAKFARANYEIMKEVANAEAKPMWNAGNFFGELYGGPMAAANDNMAE